jgi:sulfatase modifying factor 1
VVHVAYEDADAYARWAGKELSNEAQWEFASRGGLDGKKFTWGDENFPGSQAMANSWQGDFPWQNLLRDGFDGTSPAGSSRPTATNCSAWSATCGNGHRTGTLRAAPTMS